VDAGHGVGSLSPTGSTTRRTFAFFFKENRVEYNFKIREQVAPRLVRAALSSR
jgi:hypothetical protein